MYRVAVAMSSYNGEAYIREQVESIFSQTDVEVALFVRDDGSTDGTCALLSDMKQQYPGIHLIRGKNAGIGNSFMRCLYAMPDTYDFYALADQDDIWLPDKMSRAISVLHESGKKLYFSNQTCLTADGRREERYKSEPAHTAVSTLFGNHAAGCTMVFDRDFFLCLTDPANRPSPELLRIRIHDVWIAMVGAVQDEIVYDGESRMLYRQHGDNAVGAKGPSLPRVIRSKLRKIRDGSKRNAKSRLAGEIAEKFPEAAASHPYVLLCRDPHSLRGKAALLSHYGEAKPYYPFPMYVWRVVLGAF